jgi:hypothetical protein
VLVPIFTLALNLVLAFMVIGKLVLTRKAMLAMGQHMIAATAQYITTINIVVESALPWIVSTALLVVSAFATTGSEDQKNWPGMFVFAALYDLMGVSAPSIYKTTT